MVLLAETLAQEYDFVRVDCFNVNGRVFLGEMTPYPGGVAAKFEPETLDDSLGRKWGRTAVSSGNNPHGSGGPVTGLKRL